jgi:hypothetical protein
LNLELGFRSLAMRVLPREERTGRVVHGAFP